MPGVRLASGRALESDAALLRCRTHASQAHTQVVLVDGSVVRTIDGRALVALPAPVGFRETVA